MKYSRFAGLIILFLFSMHVQAQKSQPDVKNVILLIGDGMGVAQVHAAYTANQGQLNMYKATHTGFSKTSSANKYITDSGAGGTAISSGVKTNNYTVGIDENGKPVKTILERAEENDLSTGLVSTSAITHATPASFIAHRESRNNYIGIASDFLGSGIDIFIGGGKNHFEGKPDSVNYSDSLRNEGYEIVYDLKSVKPSSKQNIGCLAADEHLPFKIEGRDDFLLEAARMSLKKLKKNKKGFFLMIEGSQIDWAGHGNDKEKLVSEVLDFDNVVGEAFRFADKNPGTLVIVTADHETGGLSLVDGSIEEGKVEAAFGATSHTAVVVPVYTYGTGSENFTGVYENTEIHDKMLDYLELRK